MNTMASPTPSQSDTVTTISTSSDSEMEPNTNPNIRCSFCHEPFSMPKVLSCFHTFCQPCLEKMVQVDATMKATSVQCHTCKFETFVGEGGLESLKTNYAVLNMIESTCFEPDTLHCRSCKSGPASVALSRCMDCATFLCNSCTMAHQFMHCFSGHRVLDLSELNGKEENLVEKEVMCPAHTSGIMKYYCRTCRVPICHECSATAEHKNHNFVFLSEVAESEMGQLRMMEEETRRKVLELSTTAKAMANASTVLKAAYHKAQIEIEQTYRYFLSILEEKKKDALRHLDETYNSKQIAISDSTLRMHESMEKLANASIFIDMLLKNAAPGENLVLKGFIESRLQNIFNFLPDLPSQAYQFEIEFVSNYQAIETAVGNTFGYVRQVSTFSEAPKPQPIARPNGYNRISPTIVNNNNNFTYNVPPIHTREQVMNVSTPPFYQATDDNQYQKWSNGFDVQAGSPTPDIFSTTAEPCVEINSKALSSITGAVGTSTSAFPLKCQIRRQKMIYNQRFGEFGMREGQFTEPSGVACNAQDDIIVADTNNHRIQIFDKEGRFKFQFGESGKRDGQMLYPNRVAVVKSSGDIIVTERSPTHQVQIYNQYGQFVRKFGANILQHPRGVAVDEKGRIIIVECKVMRVVIFDMEGNVLNKFGCSKHLQFPNSVAVNKKEHIFISDNRAHCVKVFDYTGCYLRQIGGEGITNYPIGVGINEDGHVVVADNHNNFNITVFDQNGRILSTLESKVKHAQCFDISLTGDGWVVLASKDFKLYLYRYKQQQS